jgi:transposase
MDRYIALDVHAQSTTCAVVGPTGKRLKQEVVETNASALVAFLKTIPGTRHLAFEEGTHSAWLHEALSPFVDEVVVAIVEESKGNKSDARDAWVLAEQLRSRAIRRSVFKSPREFALLRAAVRAHRLLTSDVVRVKNRLSALFRSRGLTVAEEVYEAKSRDQMLLLLPEHSRYQAEMLARQLEALEPIRAQAEKKVCEEAKKVPMVAKLETIPGVGIIRAATLVAVIITPHRFRTTRQFWSYAGLAIVTRSSADWVRQDQRWVRANVKQTRGLNWNRHPWLKSVLKGAALTVTKMAGHPLNADYERLLRNGMKPNLARLTIARRLAAVVLALWKKKEEYDSKKHMSHIVAT